MTRIFYQAIRSYNCSSLYEYDKWYTIDRLLMWERLKWIYITYKHTYITTLNIIHLARLILIPCMLYIIHLNLPLDRLTQSIDRVDILCMCYVDMLITFRKWGKSETSSRARIFYIARSYSLSERVCQRDTWNLQPFASFARVRARDTRQVAQRVWIDFKSWKLTGIDESTGFATCYLHAFSTCQRSPYSTPSKSSRSRILIIIRTG